MDYCSLQSMIELLCHNTGVHICIYDVEGVLYADRLKTDSRYKIHSKKFCDIAKDTAKGYDLCTSCKACANKKAVYGKKEFSGYCPYGLYEIVKPVVMDGKTICVIYVGNIVPDMGKAISKIRKASKITGADSEKLIRELNNAEQSTDLEKYRDIAFALDSYIRLLSFVTDGSENEKHTSGCRRKVWELIEYIEYHYDKNISLKQLAGMYFVNEKYLGRVFKAEMGCTLHQYLNNIRIKRAVAELRGTDKSILDISLDCGFGNVTYFNRRFMREFGMTPTQYRRQIND